VAKARKATARRKGTTLKERLHHLVDELPDGQAAAAQRYLEYLTAAARGVPAVLDDGAVLSEAALAEDWMRPEEDAAWSHLQPAR
jgi:hypothetical protein